MSIRWINADQNTLTIFQNGWDASNVGYVMNVIHEGPPSVPYLGGFSTVLQQIREKLPHCEMASYMSLAYLKGTQPGSPTRTLAADSFTADEVDANWRINYGRLATCKKVIRLMLSEFCYRRDTENLTSAWFDDYPTPFVPANLDDYVSFLAALSQAFRQEGISTRVNASNLFYASQTEGELTALAKCCDGICLEGSGLNDELKDAARFNYRLQLIAKYQSAITLCPVCPGTQQDWDNWIAAALAALQPAIATGKVFIGYPPQWPAPKWAED